MFALADVTRRSAQPVAFWRALLVVAACVPLCAHAICLNPFGCEPKTYDECATEATKRPTDAGVRTALAQCYSRFKKPEEDRQRTEASRAARRLAALWSEAWNDASRPITADTAQAIFGPADRVTPPSRCKGKAVAPGLCKIFYWEDLTKPPEDFTTLGLGWRQPHFYAEFLVSGQLWQRGQDSVAIF